jgi:hypothetical protein
MKGEITPMEGYPGLGKDKKGNVYKMEDVDTEREGENDWEDRGDGTWEDKHGRVRVGPPDNLEQEPLKKRESKNEIVRYLTDFARVPPFEPISDRERARKSGWLERGRSSKWGSIKMKGPCLNTTDLQVLFGIMRLLKKQEGDDVEQKQFFLMEWLDLKTNGELNKEVKTTRAKLARACHLPVDGRTYKMLYDSVRRMKETVITIKTPKIVMGHNIIDSYKLHTETGEFEIKLSEEFLACYDRSLLSNISMVSFAKTKGYIARQLMAFLATHDYKKPFFINYGKIAYVLNMPEIKEDLEPEKQKQAKRDQKKQILRACKELKDGGGNKGFFPREGEGKEHGNI